MNGWCNRFRLILRWWWKFIFFFTFFHWSFFLNDKFRLKNPFFFIKRKSDIVETWKLKWRPFLDLVILNFREIKIPIKFLVWSTEKVILYIKMFYFLKLRVSLPFYIISLPTILTNYSGSIFHLIGLICSLLAVFVWDLTLFIFMITIFQLVASFLFLVKPFSLVGTSTPSCQAPVVVKALRHSLQFINYLKPDHLCMLI